MSDRSPGRARLQSAAKPFSLFTPISCSAASADCVYGWLTEGLDTADLKAARVLLDELA